MTNTTEKGRDTTRRANATLWTVQVLLALLFLFAGGMKLVIPIENMTAQITLPGWFLRFIGVAEVSGALGLILPGLFRIRTELTPLAAAGLAIIMIGAIVVTIATNGVAPAVVPFVTGVLAAFVAYGRGISGVALRTSPANHASLGKWSRVAG